MKAPQTCADSRTRGRAPSAWCRPSPSKTFPNHYTIATGLYPGEHGMVANSMYDPEFDARFGLHLRAEVENGRWWGGEPIWVTVEKQGLRSATYFWPGTAAEIGGVRPTHWRSYDGDVPNEERVDEALRWLRMPDHERPAFITLYMSDVDSAGHDHGPDSPLTDRAIASVDAALGRLLDGFAELPTGIEPNVLVVSDHGMAATSPERVIALDDYVDLDVAGIIDWNPVAGLRPRPRAGRGGLRRPARRPPAPERLSTRGAPRALALQRPSPGAPDRGGR